MKNVFIALLNLILLAAPLAAADQKYGDFTYSSSGTAITIRGYTGSGGAVDIPATIYGLAVTSIGDWALNRTRLTTVRIPNSVTSIGHDAFSYCTSLTSVTIPESVTYIGQCAFIGCDSLTAITVDAANMSYSSVDGVFFDKRRTTLIRCPGGKYGSLLIPNSVTSIADRAFFSCTHVTDVAIPSSVTSIGDRAFAGCTGLRDVIIPNSVTSIGDSAFAACSGLSDVTIPNSVTSIGDETFSNCISLTRVTIPGSVITIGYSAFRDCTGLKRVTISDGVKSIGFHAFNNCCFLSIVDIPQSVNSIASQAFLRCASLTSFVVDEANMLYSSVDGVLFDKGQTTLIQCPGAKSGDYLIPNSVKSIGLLAFELCSHLTSVTIPNSVTSIGNAAFYNCFGLMKVTISDSVTTIGESAFGYCTSLTKVTIPKSVTSLGNGTFNECNNLTSILFEGNPPSTNGAPIRWASKNLIVYYLPEAMGWGSTYCYG